MEDSLGPILATLAFLVLIFILVPPVHNRIVRKKKVITGISPTNENARHELNNDTSNNKKIFINYRKEDSSGYALALYHELKKWYDKNTIYKDFNSVEPGEGFEESIDNALTSCNILLVLISDRWMEILKQRQSKTGQKDFVSLEISIAFLKNIYTIPITINGAPIPDAAGLPGELKNLTRRQFLDIDQTRFETDTLKLARIIDKRLGIQRNL